jgi:hypothetical protein
MPPLTQRSIDGAGAWRLIRGGAKKTRDVYRIETPGLVTELAGHGHLAALSDDRLDL